VDTSVTTSTALLTDHYELTMLDAAVHSGIAEHRAVFEVFTRSLPAGRRYGVLCGTGRLLDELERFRFGASELGWLRERGFLSPEALDRLDSFRFSGRIDGYAEGELYFPSSPVLTVEAPFVEALALETLTLSILNFDSAIASAASRMVTAARGHPLIEGGSRRTHERAALAAARAAWITGFSVTSNLEAARHWGIPSAGTVAHAFTLAHSDERRAFEAQNARFGTDTTYLVDTFDVERAITSAVEIAGPGIGGIRLDSGDLALGAHRARELLDDLGATGAKITASGDLDEYAIDRLADAPIDQFMVGTSLVTGSGAPTAQMVYKLVAIADAPGPDAPLRPVEKHSSGKATIGGRKVAHRTIDHDGYATAERVVTDGSAPPPRARPLQVCYVDGGRRATEARLQEARDRHEASLAELRPSLKDIADGAPAFVAGPDAATAAS
jgi:nicotinate phosphoribosyltransferase